MMEKGLELYIESGANPILFNPLRIVKKGIVDRRFPIFYCDIVQMTLD
jgi:hypothetical protein